MNIHSQISNYYNNPEMRLIKADNQWATYAAKINTGLLNQIRYLFAVVPTFGFIQRDTMSLNELKWFSFQTRTTEDHHPGVPAYSIYINEDRKNMFLEELVVIDRNDIFTEYRTHLPVRIRLIHDPKKRNKLQWPDKLLMWQALETYQCVIDTF